MATQLDSVRLVDRVLVFFARHPEEVLSTTDVSIKFDVSQEEVRTCLRHAVEDGRIAKQSKGRGPHPVVYSAGPVLLQMIGVVMEACAPSSTIHTMAGGR